MSTDKTSILNISGGVVTPDYNFYSVDCRGDIPKCCWEYFWGPQENTSKCSRYTKLPNHTQYNHNYKNEQVAYCSI